MNKSLGEVMQDKAHGLYRCPCCIGDTKTDANVEGLPWLTLEELDAHNKIHSTAELFGAAYALIVLAD